MERELAAILPLCGVILGWVLGRCPTYGSRKLRRRKAQMEQEWENLFSYDGQRQEGTDWNKNR